MVEHQKLPFTHFSALISQARRKLGYATLKDLYRDKQPNVEYQTWAHAESGRRVPTPDNVITIGDLLQIDRADLLIAYCRDRFPDEASQDVLESFSCKRFVDVDTIMEAKAHDRYDDYMLTAEQLNAMREDIRLRLFLTYTYNDDYVTTVERLMNYFHVSEYETRNLLARLEKLGLVETHDDEVKRCHRHMTIPQTPDNFDLRKNLLLKALEINTKPDSYIANWHVRMTPESFQRIQSLFDFAEANVIQLEREDYTNHARTQRFQFSIVGNRVDDGGEL